MKCHSKGQHKPCRQRKAETAYLCPVFKSQKCYNAGSRVLSADIHICQKTWKPIFLLIQLFPQLNRLKWLNSNKGMSQSQNKAEWSQQGRFISAVQDNIYKGYIGSYPKQIFKIFIMLYLIFKFTHFSYFFHSFIFWLSLSKSTELLQLQPPYLLSKKIC